MTPEVNGVFFWETAFAGKRHPHYGRFLELDPNRRVELTWVTAATKGVETVVCVEFEPRGAGTLCRLTHRGFPDDESRAQAHPCADHENRHADPKARWRKCSRR